MPRPPPVTTATLPASPDSANIIVISRKSKSAVDDQRMAVDHVGFRQAQEINGVGDGVGRQYRPGGCARCVGSQQFLAVREIGERVGIDHTGVDGIDPDAAGPQLLEMPTSASSAAFDARSTEAVVVARVAPALDME